MMETLESLFTNYTFQVVAAGAGALGLLSGVTGTFATLKEESLLGDALSHAALPGLGISFLITGQKNMLLLLLGAAASGLVATGLIHLMRDKSIIKTDSALSLVIAIFFGLGMVLMSYIQRQPNANQAGLDSFIYGQVSSMLIEDVWLIIGAIVIILVIVVLFWKELKLNTFDPSFAETVGFSSKFLNGLVSTLIVLTVILGLQSVGVILMSALLVGPAVAARQWTNRLYIMVILAGTFGMVSGVIGTVISSISTRVPTGPTVVLVISLIILISLVFSPKRGLISRMIHRKRRLNELRQKTKYVIGKEEVK